MIGNILSQPLWVVISKKIRKKPALLSGIILTIIAVFGVIFIYLFRIELYQISYFFMLGAIFICGIGSGSLYSLPSSLYGDEIMKINNKQSDMVATYSGSITFAGNIANSITQLLIGVLLDVIKFDSSMSIQTLAVQTGLALILFVGVQLSLIVACAIFAGFNEHQKS